MPYSAEKCKMGALWDLLTYIQLQNIKKLEGGPFGDIKKIFEKKSHSAEKNPKGGPFSTDFKKYKTKGGTLWNNLDAFPGYSFSFL